MLKKLVPSNAQRANFSVLHRLNIQRIRGAPAELAGAPKNWNHYVSDMCHYMSIMCHYVSNCVNFARQHKNVSSSGDIFTNLTKF